ncbi:DUF4235 domain-containing protein [Streptomyces lacrimifluminis]|uniref:Membrane protein n=1 Tax=Streptomyces lacrimifluminis TaxID=1500077 RepID=A0A917P748_9ACTN|nr:DUF4235 domain-containing protein [Streptomyces lacrimifluminis]GGJ64939.1 membrane protein [Streptomyces lacrimifluminis]
MKTSKAAYKPVGMAMGILGGLLAGAVFKQAWKRLAHEDEAPDATDEFRSWREVLGAAVVQGAIFAGVRAAVDRGGATAIRRLTGTWPG